MPYMSRETGENVVKLVIVALVCLLLVVGYVFWTSYQGRIDTVKAQRAGCERAKLDRRSNSAGWRTAQTARLSTLAEEMNITIQEARGLLYLRPKPDDLPDLIAARRYDRIASGQEERSRIVCSTAFPAAKLIP